MGSVPQFRQALIRPLFVNFGVVSGIVCLTNLSLGLTVVVSSVCAQELLRYPQDRDLTVDFL